MTTPSKYLLKRNLSQEIDNFFWKTLGILKGFTFV